MEDQDLNKIKEKLNKRPTDPEIVQLNLIGEKLANDMALFDLTPEQNLYFSAVLSMHVNGYYMPFTVQFIRNYLAFSQSRDRMGRQELVNLLHGALEYAKTKFRNVGFVDDYQHPTPYQQEQKRGNPLIIKIVGYALLFFAFIWVLMMYGGG